MRNALTTDSVSERLAAIKQRLEDIVRERHELQLERDDLFAVQRTFDRMSGASPSEAATAAAQSSATAALSAKPVVSVSFSSSATGAGQMRIKKPDNIPTMPEMILETLEIHSLVTEGMPPKDITAFIAERWWPEVTFESVGPIAWRMHRDGKIAKNDKGYALNAETPDVRPSGVSGGQ
jgi:hypothetical protein